MKDLILDASKCEQSCGLSFSIDSLVDFPRTADQRVYHLGIRAGEVANRIVRF